MSDWINFVKMFAKQNGLTYGESLREASKYYKGGRGEYNVAESYGGAKKRKSKKKSQKSGSKRSSPKRSGKSSTKKKYYNAGVMLGGIAQSKNPKGALTSLLSGLKATIAVE